MSRRTRRLPDLLKRPVPSHPVPSRTAAGRHPVGFPMPPSGSAARTPGGPPDSPGPTFTDSPRRPSLLSCSGDFTYPPDTFSTLHTGRTFSGLLKRFILSGSYVMSAPAAPMLAWGVRQRGRTGVLEPHRDDETLASKPPSSAPSATPAGHAGRLGRANAHARMPCFGQAA
jgi:hypothetical protein